MANSVGMWMLLASLACPAVHAADAVPEAWQHSELRQQCDMATWPADIVRLCDRTLSSEPAATDAPSVAAIRDLAAQTARILGSNAVKLQRGAFHAPELTGNRRLELRQAALGDADAAIRLARLYQHGFASLPADAYRYLGWLQFAAALGSDNAAYELALFYRRTGQPALAAMYETQAVALGYSVPLALDHIRK